MNPIYPRFARAHSFFYDVVPARVGSAQPFAPSPALSWTGWTETDGGVWSYWKHDSSIIADQGWKVHVSSTLDVAHRVLEVVSAYCGARRLAFKFLRDKDALLATLSKDAERGSSGKFITIYPGDPGQLRSVLEDLDAAIGGLPGPYVLSDLRWRSGPLYVRYGAFTMRPMNVNGHVIPGILNLHSGLLEPDLREPRFHVPSWVETPGFISAQLEEIDQTPPVGFPLVRRALHHSNAGGVYLADLDRRAVVLKEARPHTGLTPDGRDAVARLRDEADLLRRLDSVPIPRILSTFEAFGHHFLVMEQVPGLVLPQAAFARHPLIRAGATSSDHVRYRDWALKVARAITLAVQSLHDEGYCHGDLHPGNIFVDPECNVALIDLEMARPLDETILPSNAMGAPGFVSGEALSALEWDRYAVACIHLFLFLPLTPILSLAPDKAAQLVEVVRNTFDLDASWCNELLCSLQLGLVVPENLGVSHAGEKVNRRLSPSALLDPTLIASALHGDVRLDRADRLWPGDPAQFAEPVFGLAHGALGVMVALGETGMEISCAVWSRVDEALEQEWNKGRSARGGLLDGLYGAAWACRALGAHERADRLLERLREVDLADLGSDLYSGLPGVGLVALAESEQDHRFLDVAIDAARRLESFWENAPYVEIVETGRAGLLRGGAGTSLFAMRLFEQTGDTAHLRLAELSAKHDMACLVQLEDGSLQVNEGWRTLPYLGSGAAGIGIVLAQLAKYSRTPDCLVECVQGISLAAQTPFAIQAGLFEGRAGLMQFLMAMEEQGLGDDASRTALESHRNGLKLHALHCDAGTRFAGNGNLRASSDLATGAAGILLTLRSCDPQLAGDAPGSNDFPFLRAPMRPFAASLSRLSN